VAGFAWEEVDENTRNYLIGRESDPKRSESVPERTALYPGLGHVIAIGIWKVGGPPAEDDTGLILLEGDSTEREEWDRVPHSAIIRGDEAELLACFWKIVADRKRRLVTYNGRGYDGPMLMIRSAQLGVPPSRNLTPYRYDISDHCDLMDVLGFQGASRDKFTLDYWCRRFDVESPKGGLDGSQVGRAYREGRIDEIGEYCLRDVRATAELYRKLEGSLLPLFKGGT
jgi:DNA polymerase elongation subunit (family B)